MSGYGNITKIADQNTVADWKLLRDKLEKHKLSESPTTAEKAQNSPYWKRAYWDFFYRRLNTRYLEPICLLTTLGESKGEGFSIVSIQCSLIEFLQSTYDGMNFNKGTGSYKENLGKGKNEYGFGSSDVFTKFLETQAPFNNVFGVKGSVCKDDFYSNVRCALLHEAGTREGWKIIRNSTKNQIVEIEGKEKKLYRNQFQAALLEYIGNYLCELIENRDRQDAFIEKFDGLCRVCEG